MRIVIAPDSFKGSLSAFDAAQAMLRGVRRACPQAQVDVCPLSDGGEGFADVLLQASGGTPRPRGVTGPSGERVEARWAMLADGRTAVIESAEASGRDVSGGATHLQGGPRTASVSCCSKRPPGALGRSSSGWAAAPRRMVARGWRRPSESGSPGRRDPSPERAWRTHSGWISAPGMPASQGSRILAVTDVDNPLTGIHGAARVYGPQKGATGAEVERLEAALAHLAAMMGDPGTHPGDGAAGGLGYGLRVFAGARVGSGIEFVLDAVGFGAKLDGCDLVLTGEGRLDATSARGKVVAGVCRRSGPRGVPVVALVGAIGPGASALRDVGLTACFSLCDGPRTESEAREHAGVLLAELPRTSCACGAGRDLRDRFACAIVAS